MAADETGAAGQKNAHAHGSVVGCG
jgi:hypothetical protein